MEHIQSLYRLSDHWENLAKLSLEGCESITDNPLPQNYEISNEAGSYQALLDIADRAVCKKELTTELLIRYNDLIVKDFNAFGISIENASPSQTEQENLSSLINRINENVQTLNQNVDPVDLVNLLTMTAQEIEKKQIFTSTKQRVTNLLLNYILTYVEYPLIVFSADEKPEYRSALLNDLQLNIFMAGKIREHAFFQGFLLDKVGGKYASDRYAITQEGDKVVLTIEWHPLAKAVREWKEKLAIATNNSQ